MARVHTPRRWLPLAWVTIIVVAAAAITLVVHAKTSKSLPKLPDEVAKQISFILYIPDSSWLIAAKQATYANGILTLNATKDNSRLTITEEVTPDVFTDVPQYYPALLRKLNEYVSIGTVNGTAYLTHPTELKGGQQAVLNHNGTLMFVHPGTGLSNDTWRRFFNNLRLVKPE